MRILIAEDDFTSRRLLQKMLEPFGSSDVATASDPYVAARRLKEQVPDVITLDVEMPRMDGLTFLRKIMSQHPIPVVMCSSLTDDGSDTALKALEYGAVDIITKPRLGTKQFLEEAKVRICDAVKAAAGARLRQ
jgi:two-component system chemotaxis response regulator CheB